MHKNSFIIFFIYVHAHDNNKIDYNEWSCLANEQITLSYYILVFESRIANIDQ